MPEPDGVATTALIKKTHPAVDVVVVTSFGEAHRVHGALEAGATGYVFKDANVDEIIEGIRPHTVVRCISTPPWPGC